MSLTVFFSVMNGTYISVSKKINNGKVLSERERRVNLNNNMTSAKRN